MSIDIPLAILPPIAQIGVDTSSVSEADVQMPATNTKNQKRRRRPAKPARAYSGIPAVVSTPGQRAPGVVSGVRKLPTRYDFESYTFGGPFKEDTNEMPTEEIQPRFELSENKPVDTETRKDTWFSKLLRPADDELEAERQGLRWNWALEHRFMPPGSKWNETVWNGVDRENQFLAKLIAQQKAQGGLMSPIAQMRLRGQFLDQYNKLVNEYKEGNWDDPERAYTDFANEVMRLKGQFKEAGFNPDDLRLPPPVSGKRGGFTTQAGPSKLRRQWNYANTVNNKLGEWIQSGKINDPEFMGSSEVTAYLDSTYETIIKYLKESSNAMADAEKQRLQILTLTDDGTTAVRETIKAYQKALAGVMASASAKDWSQNNRGKVNEIIKAMGFDPDKTDKNSLGDQMAVAAGVIASALAKNDELPHDVASDLKAIQEQYDNYIKNMMFAANVAPHIVASMASALGRSAGDAYNDQAFAAGRQTADNLGDIEDLTGSIGRNAVPMSPLLEPPTFIVPSLAPRPKGKVTTNPESKGENKPASTANVPGVELEGF